MEELVIEKHLRITRGELRYLELWTIDRCEAALNAAPKVACAASSNDDDTDDDDDDELRPLLPTDMVAAIKASLPAMRAEMAAIMSDAVVGAAIRTWRNYRGEAASLDPANCSHTWATLGNVAAVACANKTPEELAAAKAMLRCYVALRSTAAVGAADAALVKGL